MEVKTKMDEERKTKLRAELEAEVGPEVVAYADRVQAAITNLDDALRSIDPKHPKAQGAVEGAVRAVVTFGVARLAMLHESCGTEMSGHGFMAVAVEASESDVMSSWPGGESL